MRAAIRLARLGAAALALALAATNLKAQIPDASDGLPDFFLHPPPWGEADRRLDRDVAATCLGPGAEPILLTGRSLYSGQRTSVHAAAVSGTGVVVVSAPGELTRLSLNYQALIWPDGVDRSSFAQPFDDGDIVTALSLSSDGRYLSWRSALDRIEILDIPARRRVPTPAIDCIPGQTGWLGAQLLVSCQSGKPGEALNLLFAPADGGFRQAAVFTLDEAELGRRAVVDESATLLVRGDKVYQSLDAALADGALPDLAYTFALSDHTFRLGDRLLQVTGADSGDSTPDNVPTPPTLTLRDATNGRVLTSRTLAGANCRPRAMAVAPDGWSFAMVFSSGDVVAIFDARTLAPLAAYALRRSMADPAIGLAILPDGRLVAWSDMDVEVYTPPAH